MTKNDNVVTIDLEEVTNSCFIVMPFDPMFNTQYERVIRPAVESVGLDCVRGDEIFSKPNIMADIWKSMREARVIIAELTGRNPNVLYEVGLAHAVGKPIIFLTRDENDVPFDLKALRYRYYDTNDPFWGENLKNSIQEMIKAALDESSMSVYLEGISVPHSVQSLPQQTKKQPRPQSILDISGNWNGSWKRHNTTIEHSGKLFIAQDSGQVRATMTVTFEKSNELTVIQEELSGSIKDSKISLVGISYTYIRQGNSTSYLLDSFELQLAEDGQQMSGSFRSKRGNGDSSFDREKIADSDNT